MKNIHSQRFRRFPVVLWVLVFLYAVARLAQAYSDKLPMLAIVALHVLAPLAFALVHGAVRYGIRGILVFMGLCLAVGNLFENLSIATGFPFGHYHFTDVMGPKLFQIPILLGLAYAGIGYVSWMLGLIIVGNFGRPLTGSLVIKAPLVAALIMVAWDLAMDPIWSNLVHGWFWHDGGSYFGVPLSNFFGWYLTVYSIYQCFALYQQKYTKADVRMPDGFWKQAVIFYGLCGAGNLVIIGLPELAVITDQAGTAWKVSHILAASSIVSIFIMCGYALVSWVRIQKQAVRQIAHAGTLS